MSLRHNTVVWPAPDPRDGDVLRLLERYWREVVIAWGACPWAEAALGDMPVGIVWGQGAALTAGCRAVLHAWNPPRTAMIVAPEGPADPRAWRALRDELAPEFGDVALADFHPQGGEATLTTPAKLVALLRRSPDPLLQIVLRREFAPMAPVEWIDARNLHTLAAPPDPRAHLAAHNFATVQARGLEALLAVLADISADRKQSY